VDKERRRAQDEITLYKIYGQFFLGNFERTKELIRKEDQRLSDSGSLTRGLFLYVQMYFAWYEGQGQVVLAKGNQAIKAFQDAGLVKSEIAVRRLQAQVSAHEGFPREAVAMMQEIVFASRANRSFAINELVETQAGSIFIRYWIDDIEGAQREQQSALALAQRLANPVLVHEIDSLSALFAMARPTIQSSERKDARSMDTMGTVPQLNSLYLHQLVRQGQVERAWHLATGLGVQLDREKEAENLGYFISLIEVALARGIELDAARSRARARAFSASSGRPSCSWHHADRAYN
jgi:hypothetical protein